MPIRRADEESNRFYFTVHFQRFHLPCERAGIRCFAPLVEGDAVAALGGFQKPRGDGRAVTCFDNNEFTSAVPDHSFKVIRYGRFCVIQRGLTRHNDTKSHTLRLAEGCRTLQLLSISMKYIIIIPLVALVACAPQPGPVKRQMIGLLEKFDRWDYNGDGQLTLSELEEAEEMSGLPPADILAFYDTSKNGRISLAEAEAGMSRIDEAKLTVKEIKKRP